MRWRRLASLLSPKPNKNGGCFGQSKTWRIRLSVWASGGYDNPRMNNEGPILRLVDELLKICGQQALILASLSEHIAAIEDVLRRHPSISDALTKALLAEEGKHREACKEIERQLALLQDAVSRLIH